MRRNFAWIMSNVKTAIALRSLWSIKFAVRGFCPWTPEYQRRLVDVREGY